ncbi:hypothetical protein CXF67_03630 [Psychroflexus sp. MES1-P1E]|nr:hypothetical protein CXF67_03630 [Psychroflexus sp. MES1-P1E]
MTSKSIEQLENNVWETPNEFLTDMIKRCYQYRKISISELTTDQMRLLISKKIGVYYLIGIILEKLKSNILAEGDFLVIVSIIPAEYWTKNKKYQLHFNGIVGQNANLIKSELGEKEFDRIQDVESRKHNNVYKT